ncbi:MarR family winged helix-turn-helix transcriptional regulator [Bradyrhizobium neotropicale]|uniref:MarR family winged helix-turn-helix transcriptional regulator n=1 Tax=Bradyrhizobium neotropicale TaxID=1497615 RepID=UPI001AD6ACE9|nr:MarR family winged helix-turn-helix transcriptional regulator [Bradyrhizobium neotropicale]MBO4224097.1 hypothetical protein [Bradyrhizobium neotropicale]
MAKAKKSSATVTMKRKPRDLRPSVDHDRRVIDFDRYIPTVVSRLMTRLRASAQIFFDERFGITRLDWRIISFLAAKGPSSAYDIWTLGILDKAAVSRALRVLSDRKIVTIKNVSGSSRRRTVIALTRQGQELNDRCFVEIVKRHDRLLGGLSRKQIEDFILTAQHLESRIAFMDKDDECPSSNFDVTKEPEYRKQPHAKVQAAASARMAT